MTKYLEIGQIVNTFGIKGMVKVKPFTDDIRRFDRLKKVYIEKQKVKEEYEIEEVKYHKEMVLIKFKGIENPEQANLLRNCYLFVNREEKLGIVEDIFNTGSNDIYVVRDELGKQILLPATKEVIKKVDIENKKIIVHLLPGLI